MGDDGLHELQGFGRQPRRPVAPVERHQHRLGGAQPRAIFGPLDAILEKQNAGLDVRIIFRILMAGDARENLEALQDRGFRAICDPIRSIWPAIGER